MAVTRGPFNVAPLFLKPARAALFEDADSPFLAEDGESRMDDRGLRIDNNDETGCPPRSILDCQQKAEPLSFVS